MNKDQLAKNPKIRLFYNRGSCSLASHIALEESGLAYETEWIDLSKGAHETREYRAINPAARVPALQLDDVIVTENVAILNLIADLVPERALLPPAGSFERIRALECMAYLASTVHVAFRPIFRPNRLASSDTGIAEVRTQGVASLRSVLEQWDERLRGQQFCLGNEFSLCDAYLFVFHQWSRRGAIPAPRPELPAVSAIAARVATRPSTQRVLAAEGVTFVQ
jgi:glutathione S-transferase